jgi:hypothetical protein
MISCLMKITGDENSRDTVPYRVKILWCCTHTVYISFVSGCGVVLCYCFLCVRLRCCAALWYCVLCFGCGAVLWYCIQKVVLYIIVPCVQGSRCIWRVYEEIFLIWPLSEGQSGGGGGRRRAERSLGLAVTQLAQPLRDPGNPEASPI